MKTNKNKKHISRPHNKTKKYKKSITPLKIYNVTHEGVPLEIQIQQLQINELNRTPTPVACPISNLHRRKRGGWQNIRLSGTPYQIGYQHGTLLSKQLQKVIDIFPIYVKNELNQSYESFMTNCMQIIKPILQEKYPDIYEELQGISDGSEENGTPISIDLLIAWNSQMSITQNTQCKGQRCSAFIATGNRTKTGEIIMSHNTHSDYLSGQLFNIIFHITPNKGTEFIMQSAPGLIWSMTDWFICKSGIIGCESTNYTNQFDPHFGTPIFCRIRQAMQYAKNIDEFTQTLLYDNAGDYPCSWLLGDTKTNEIALFELGKSIYSLERTDNGIYYTMNSPHNTILRQNETRNPNEYNNIKSSSGSRNHRFQNIFQSYDKLDIPIAKKIISDHYDPFLKKENPGYRTICKHNEISKQKKYYPFGTCDAKITTTELAKQMQFIAKWGPPCNQTFNSKQFIHKHPKYQYLEPYLEDFKKELWTTIF